MCYVVELLLRAPSNSGGDMGTSERRRPLANTEEFVAMWSATKEEHFVQELVQLLPELLGSGSGMRPESRESRDISFAPYI